MFRVLLIFLAMLIITRLISILIRSVRMYTRESVNHKKGEKEVGEGWIVEDRVDEDEKD